MKLFLLFIPLTIFSACDTLQKKEYKSPAGYDLNHPEKFLMPESLLEISGITFYNNNADTIYAIQDEQGKLFRVPLGNKESFKTKFGKHGDYEDLAIMQDVFFILKSNGSFYTFPFADRYNEETDNTAEWKKVLPKGEYESLFADAAGGNIYALCKDCDADKKTSQATGYILQWQHDSLILNGRFRIAVSEIQQLTNKRLKAFKPSAMAKNPLTGEWYIIASIDKLLVITGADWKVKQVFSLDSGIFNQPEGMAFDKSNNLYISNEGSDLNNGNILKFNYKPGK